MGPRTIVSLAAVTGLVALLGGCSTAPAPSVTQSSARASTSAPPLAGGGPSAGRQSAEVRPASGLRNGQAILITGSGFAPGRSLVAVQCADKGAATAPGDCDLERMFPVTADAQGRVSVKLQVRKGPFGSNRVVCGGIQKCLVSVADAAQPPQEQAAAPIAFG